jgi:hypothetical protein
MPWDQKTTDHNCIHCEKRGYKNVKLIWETFYREVPMRRNRKDEHNNIVGVVHTTGRRWPTITDEQGRTGMITRTRCPHWRCEQNEPIRQLRNKHRSGRSARKS